MQPLETLKLPGQSSTEDGFSNPPITGPPRSSAQAHPIPGVPKSPLVHLHPQALDLSWRLRVTFSGNLAPRTYITPDIRHTDPGWGSELFNRPIEQIEFFLPTGHKVLMAGMEQYNFFVEAEDSFSRRGVTIAAFWLCGKFPSPAPTPTSDIRNPPSDIDMWRIGNGKVIHQQRPWGQEWGGAATRGWKPGSIGKAPCSQLI